MTRPASGDPFFERALTWRQKRIMELRQKGLCERCGQTDILVTKTMRQGCITEARNRTKRRKARRDHAGMCIQCGQTEQQQTNKRCVDCAAKKSDHERIARRRRREEMFTAYGNRCACCGESQFEFLTLDHINNDGAAHRKELGGNVPDLVCRDLRKRGWPEGYQLLCWNCNCAKGFYGECPHKKEKE